MSKFCPTPLRTLQDIEQFEQAQTFEQRLPMRSVYEVFEATAARLPDRTALTMLVGERKLGSVGKIFKPQLRFDARRRAVQQASQPLGLDGVQIEASEGGPARDARDGAAVTRRPGRGTACV